MGRQRRPFEQLDDRAKASMRRGEDAAWLRWDPELLDSNALEERWVQVLKAQADGTADLPLAVYMHFSYCRRSCSFCMYHHSVPKGRGPYEVLAASQVARLDALERQVGTVPVATAYWGGGTPTAVPEDLLESILTAHGRAFAVAGEFTVEAHPQTLTPSLLRTLAAGGVNRLSIGLQSLDPAVLKTITRRNRRLDELDELMRTSRDVDVEINMDLVAGLPGQTLGSLRKDIASVVQMAPKTVTVYRYQPVRTLPHAGTDDLASEVVFTRPWVDTLDGYQAFATPYSTLLFRSPGTFQLHTAQSIAAAPESAPDLRATSKVQYHEYDGGLKHLLGLGPGAISHLVGYAWYRDVTLQSALPFGRVYCGTKLDWEDERAQRVRKALLADGKAALPDAGRTRETLLNGVEAGALRLSGGQVAWVEPDASAEHDIWIEQLMPSIPVQTHLPLNWPEQADPTLSMIPGAPPGAKDGVPPGASLPEPASDALERWCALLGLPEPGGSFEGARLVRMEGARVAFEWDGTAPDGPSRQLRVMVEEADDERPSFAASTNYALSYVGAEYADLGDVERAFLQLLVDRTRRADGPG